MRYDGRDFGGADKLASASSSQRWATGGDEPNLGCGIQKSGDVCEGWETDKIDDLMAMGDDTKGEKKGHLDIMTLIYIGLSLYLIILIIKWLFFMD